jgi:hypothetical protein
VSEAAAAAAPAPAAADTTQAAAPAAADAKGAPAKTTAQEWDASAESQLFDLMKRSPYGKLKANGKEELLDGPDKLKSALLDAARGRGASKLAEEAKREKAEAAQVRQRAELLERALEGDAEALRQLGRVRPEERQAQEKALAELPPEVRALIEENNALRQEQERRNQAEAQAQRAQETAKSQALQAKYREEGLAMARGLVSKLGTAESAETMLPYVLQAWKDLTDVGLEAGEDVNEDHVVAMAQRLFEEDTDKRFDRLAPKTFLGSAMKRLAALPPEEALANLDDATATKWAKHLAKRLHGRRNAAPTQPAQPQESRQRNDVVSRMPLSPMRGK